MSKELSIRPNLIITDKVKEVMTKLFSEIKPSDFFQKKPMSQPSARVNIWKAVSILALHSKLNKEEVVDYILLTFFEKEFGMKMPDEVIK